MADAANLRRVIVGISGASGAVYGARLLQVLQGQSSIETHLVVSDAGWRNLRHELDMNRPAVEALAHRVHDVHNVGAAIASGSFDCHAMVVAPCSMRTLAAVAHGLADNLLTRAADVALKERRTLVLVPRETPYSAIHLENMLRLTRAGALVLPASPGFYHRPAEIGELVDFVVARVLDQLGVAHSIGRRWGDSPEDR